MSNKNYTSELAKYLKSNQNNIKLGIQVGEVKSISPELIISIGSQLLLTKDDLVISAHVLENYNRDVEINGNIEIDSNISDCTITGNIKYTNSLNVGDKVILIPSEDEQVFYLIDKVGEL